MTIRSMPPASSNLALMPVPAPPPMMGTPALICFAEPLEHFLSGECHGLAPFVSMLCS